MDILSIPALVKSALLALHLLGLVLGLGAATMLDLIIVRFVGSRTVTHEYWSVISLLSKAVTGGLVLLWISGIGFLTHYAFFNPTLLTNPKIWGKDHDRRSPVVKWRLHPSCRVAAYTSAGRRAVV